MCVYIYIYLCTIQSCNSTRHKIYFTQLGVNCVYNSENKYFFGKLLDVLLFALYMEMKQCFYSIINSSYYLSPPSLPKALSLYKNQYLR